MRNKYLNQAYPKEVVNPWSVILLISLFISIFMLIFQPFGLASLQSNYKSWIIAGYGGVTLVVLVLNIVVLQQLFKSVFNAQHWTILKEILFLFWILFCVGAGNYIYTHIIFNINLGFLTFQLYTLSIGAIPVIGITLINQNILVSRNLKKAEELNDLLRSTISKEEPMQESVVLRSENERTKLELLVDDLLYIESEGNYVNVSYLLNGDEQNILLRSTLKNLELQLRGVSQMVRCHRAFIINRNYIAQATGNAQGLTLSLKRSDNRIPVSRNFVNDIKAML